LFYSLYELMCVIMEDIKDLYKKKKEIDL